MCLRFDPSHAIKGRGANKLKEKRIRKEIRSSSDFPNNGVAMSSRGNSIKAQLFVKIIKMKKGASTLHRCSINVTVALFWSGNLQNKTTMFLWFLGGGHHPEEIRSSVGLGRRLAHTWERDADHAANWLSAPRGRVLQNTNYHILPCFHLSQDRQELKSGVLNLLFLGIRTRGTSPFLTI